MPDRELMLERLERLATVLDELMPRCAELVRDTIAMLKEQGKTGHWIYKKDDGVFMCSCCEKHSIRNDYPYCHWCGAKMKGR